MASAYVRFFIFVKHSFAMCAHWFMPLGDITCGLAGGSDVPFPLQHPVLGAVSCSAPRLASTECREGRRGRGRGRQVWEEQRRAWDSKGKAGGGEEQPSAPMTRTPTHTVTCCGLKAVLAVVCHTYHPPLFQLASAYPCTPTEASPHPVAAAVREGRGRCEVYSCT